MHPSPSEFESPHSQRGVVRTITSSKIIALWVSSPKPNHFSYLHLLDGQFPHFARLNDFMSTMKYKYVDLFAILSPDYDFGRICNTLLVVVRASSKAYPFWVSQILLWVEAREGMGKPRFVCSKSLPIFWLPKVQSNSKKSTKYKHSLFLR